MTRLFKFGLSAAMIAGIVVLSQQDIFQGDSTANLSNMQPASMKSKLIQTEETAKISPSCDFVDYDPVIDLSDRLTSR